MKILDIGSILIFLAFTKLCIKSGILDDGAEPRTICYIIPLEFRQRRKLILKGNFY